MQKQIGAIMLVAGTCIGSGMIALPMLLSKLGIIPSGILMLLIWTVVYYTSLFSLELNLQAGTGLTLGALGRKFSGKYAGIIGTSCFIALAYSLLCVYLNGGSSVIKDMIGFWYKTDVDFVTVTSLYSIVTVLILTLPFKLIDYLNRIMFISLLSVIGLLILGLLTKIEWSNLPIYTEKSEELSLWRESIPVVFTAFGFQVIFHSLTNYCNNDVKMLRRAFFWGSLIPALIYFTWNFSILSAIYQENPEFYSKMLVGDIQVGQLVKALS
ncbi:MAG: aromatic amino acid transport family protein, partial [Pseudomonadota bacterium]